MKALIDFLGKPWLMAVYLVLFAVSMAVATFVEAWTSTAMARQYIYNAFWFELILFLGAVNLIISFFQRKLYRPEKLSIGLFHCAFVVIILGAAITRYIGFEGVMQIREGESSNQLITLDNRSVELPFSLLLSDFATEYYPCSENPSGYESQVVLQDKESGVSFDYKIYMNHILKYRGYRFYQSSYHEDMKGTVLSVSKDAAGTNITYFGYFLLFLGMCWSLVNKHTRFRTLLSAKIAVVGLFLFISADSFSAENADTLPVIPKPHAEKFGSILVRDYQGRTKPINTLASDILRKVYRKTEFNNQSATQVMLGILAFPEKWQHVPLVYAGNEAKEALQLRERYVSIYESYNGQGIFVSTMAASVADRKTPSVRSRSDNAIIRFDERLNITYHWFMGNLLLIFPVAGDESGCWYTPISVSQHVSEADSFYLKNITSVYLTEVRNAINTGDWSQADELVESINKYQRRIADDLPSDRKVKFEIAYYKYDLFSRITNIYLLLGFILLILQFAGFMAGKPKLELLQWIISGFIAGIFLLHTFGAGMLWYVSGHAPWSNAYESLVFISWSGVLAGLIFIKKNKLLLAVASILASIFLVVANMSWLDPQITNLVPVLKSVWLVIHVAVITSSYGFLGIASITAFLNLLLMIFQTRKNKVNIDIQVDRITRLTEAAIIPGLYLLTIGTFLGAIWANVSWGRYWAWDPKETWALITAIVYAIVMHLRLVKGMNSRVLFNTLAFLSYGTVLMTYFGVNFYLTGKHSYAQGESSGLPIGFYYAIGAIVILVLTAVIRQKSLSKLSS